MPSRPGRPSLRPAVLPAGALALALAAGLTGCDDASSHSAADLGRATDTGSSRDALITGTDRGPAVDPDDGVPAPDGGVSPTDDGGAPPADGGALPGDDGGAPPADTGVLPDHDAATPDRDGGPGVDARVPTGDAWVPTGDAFVPPPDEDAAVVVDPDAAPIVRCDPVPGDLVFNGGMEDWDDGVPVGWLGTESNIDPSAVSRNVDHPHCGQASLGLVNESATHKRATVPVFEVVPGHHTLVYWVRGHGEIRNAWYGTDYSNYSAYLAVDSDEWQPVSYTFNVDEAPPTGIEVIFSLRSTEADRNHLQIDDVSVVRAAGACDGVVCPDWAECNAQSGACEARFDRCGADADCPAWAACGADHTCAARPGRCAGSPDCADEAGLPLCDTDTHTCVAGDPCADVACQAWQTCRDGACVMGEGQCRTSADCLGALPACDRATARCVSADDPVNVVPNGGLETWATYEIPYHGDAFLPDFWYGLLTPRDTEIDPAAITRIETAHSGQYALQITFPGMPADRFVTEPFDLPAGTYTCGYWVRGSGDFMHRWYSRTSSDGPAFDRFHVDTDEWTPVHFTVNGNLGDLRFIFYASNTTPAHGHIQLDDLICTRNP